MDDRRFDNLTRALSGTRSRRQLLRSLAGAAAALLVPGAANAAPCGKEGQQCGCCRSDLTCTNGTCCLNDRVCNGACCPVGYTCQGGACVRTGGGGNPGGCPAGQAKCGKSCIDISSDVANCGSCGHVCPGPTPGTCQGAAICTNGVCGFAPLAAGTVCRPAAGPCDLAEACNGTSLNCPANAFAPSSTICRPAAGDCDAVEFCTGSSAACPADGFQPASVACRPATCEGGVATRAATCSGAGSACPEPIREACTPYVCGATACRTNCDSDADCVASHHCDGGVCLSDADLGAACDEDSDCASGFCVGGICCNTVCEGQCVACNLAGRVGTCSPLASGTACDDGNACTQTDTCDGAGTCVGSNPIVCTALDQCHDVGTCDPKTGVCSNPDKPNNTPCNDNNACTLGDTCQDGICTGGSPVQCPNTDVRCSIAGCDPAVGCTTTNLPAGTPCLDFFKCDGNEVCDGNGNCVEGTPVSCDECNACDPFTGTCEPTNEGLACTGDGNHCYGGFVCAGGACVGVAPVECPAPDACHEEGTCDPTSGVCSNPNKPYYTDCPGGVCINGVCEPPFCAGRGSSCTDSSQCCDGLSCAPASGPNPTCCESIIGSGCSSQFDCCGILVCFNGICTLAR